MTPDDQADLIGALNALVWEINRRLRKRRQDVQLCIAFAPEETPQAKALVAELETARKQVRQAIAALRKDRFDPGSLPAEAQALIAQTQAR